MRILPINNNYNKTQFKGKINESDFLKKALTHFNEAELKEFNTIKEKMAKVNDGKVYSLLMGTKFGYDKRNGRTIDVYYRYAELAANNPDRGMDFYNEEIYRIDVGNAEAQRELDSDNTAFARAILKPLREIYK